MRQHQYSSIYRRTFIGVVAIVLLLAGINSAYLYTIQKNRQSEHLRLHLKNELLLVDTLIQQILSTQDLASVKKFLDSSFDRYKEWLELEAKSPDGLLRVHRAREGLEHLPSIEMDYPIWVDGKQRLSIRVRHVVQNRFEDLGPLITEIIVSFILLAAAFLVLSWSVVHRLLYIPLMTLSKKIQHSEEKSRILLESTSDGIYATDLDGVCTICNPAAVQMLGYSAPSELIGKQTHRLFHHSYPDGTAYPREECTLTGDTEQTMLVENEIFWRADGTCFPVECRVSPIYTDQKVVGRVVSFTNVGRRRETESQLRHAQKLEAVGQLAAGIAHEINTPTQFVNDNTHFLRDAFDDFQRLIVAYEQLAVSVFDKPQLEGVSALAEEIDLDYLRTEVPQAIEQSLEGLGRIARIVQAMKEFSHPGTEEKTATDLNRAIETTIDVSRNEWKYSAELVTELDPELPRVAVLPGEFNQVMLNLIVNAAHAIAACAGEGGGKGEIRIDTRRDGEWVEVRVRDNGTGMSEAIQKRIFEPFFTTKEVGKGSGQGLAITWSVIVDKHQGTIEVESAEGNGTTFIVRLPVLIGSH